MVFVLKCDTQKKLDRQECNCTTAGKVRLEERNKIMFSCQVRCEGRDSMEEYRKVISPSVLSTMERVTDVIAQNVIHDHTLQSLLVKNSWKRYLGLDSCSTCSQ